MRGSRKTERDHNTTFSPISSDLSSEQKYFGDFPLMRLHKSLEIRVEVEQEEGMDANQSRDKIQHHQLHLKKGKTKPNLIREREWKNNVKRTREYYQSSFLNGLVKTRELQTAIVGIKKKFGNWLN